jgi:WD40 repeat protein
MGITPFRKSGWYDPGVGFDQRCTGPRVAGRGHHAERSPAGGAGRKRPVTGGARRCFSYWCVGSGKWKSHRSPSHAAPAASTGRFASQYVDRSALDTTSSNNLQIVDVQVPRTVAAFSWGHRVNCLAFSPDDGRLAGGDNHNQIVVWDLVAGAELFRIPMQGPVNDVRFSPNGYRLAAATRQGLFVFDAVLGRLKGWLNNNLVTRAGRQKATVGLSQRSSGGAMEGRNHNFQTCHALSSRRF